MHDTAIDRALAAPTRDEVIADITRRVEAAVRALVLAEPDPQHGHIEITIKVWDGTIRYEIVGGPTIRY